MHYIAKVWTINTSIGVVIMIKLMSKDIKPDLLDHFLVINKRYIIILQVQSLCSVRPHQISKV